MATKQGYYLSPVSAASLARDAKRWRDLSYSDTNPERCKSAYVRWMIEKMSEFLDVVEHFDDEHPEKVWRQIVDLYMEKEK